MLALVSIMVQAIFVVGTVVAVNEILMGEFSEVLERLSEGAIAENDAYFESLEFDFSVLNIALILLALLGFWVASNVFFAAVALLALGDLHSRSLGLLDTLRWGLRRLPRIMGLDLQFLLLLVAAMAIVVLSGVVHPWFLVIAIPALVVVGVWSISIFFLASVVAALGPPEWSLRCAARLVRGRFWGTLGRILVVQLIIIAVSIGVSVAFTLGSWSLDSFFGLNGSWQQEAIDLLLAAVLGLFGGVASVIIYCDLGGQSDAVSDSRAGLDPGAVPEPGADSDSGTVSGSGADSDLSADTE